MKLILKNSKLIFARKGYDSDAIALMGKYTKVLTDGQKDAVNTLVLSLKDAGVYTKLTAAYFPCLAGTLGEAFYDAITETDYDLSSQNVYSLDSNGLGSTFDSSHKLGVRVDTNLDNSIESLFTSLYEDGDGDSHTSSGVNWNCAFSGGYPLVSDTKRRVFTNGSSTTDGAQVAATALVGQTKHYAAS